MFAGRGGPGWLGAHVVADAGHDVAEVVQVVAGQGVEQQAGDLDVAGQDAVDQGPAVVGDGDQGGALGATVTATASARSTGRIRSYRADQAAAGRLAGKTVLTP